MAEPTAESLETILRHIEAAAPEPWYPKLHAETVGVPRDGLDPPLEKLRMAGLIRLTDWVQGNGQGYVLTPEGIRALQSERDLAKLRDGRVKPRPLPVRRTPRSGTAFDRGEDVRNVFLYPTRPTVTKLLLMVNILAFLAGYLIATQQKVDGFLEGGQRGVPMPVWRILHATGAMSGEDIALGGWEWLRLLTSAFVHIGLIHLVMNSFALFILGRDAESMYGHARFLVLYLVSAVGGSCGMLIEQTGGGAGASGAVCGLLGGIGVWFLLNRSHMPPEVASRGFRAVMINAVLVIGISFVPHVSKGGHLGGAIAGAAVAVALHFVRYGRAPVRWLALAAIPLVPIAGIGALIHTMRTAPAWAQLRENTQVLDEYRELRGRFRRDIVPALAQAKDAYQQAYEEALQMNPVRRDAEKKQKAIANLAAAQDNLKAAAEQFGDGLVTKDVTNEAAREIALELAGTWKEICRLAESYLKNDANLINENEKTIQSLQKSAKDLEGLCHKYGLFE